MTNEQDMQQKVILFQLLHKHMEELKQQAALLEQRFMEFGVTKHALGDFKDKRDKDMLDPLGSGCYVFGKAPGSTDLLVNIGANIMIKKPIGETAELLDNRTKEIQDISKNLEEQMANVVGQIGTLTAELEKMQK